MSLILIPQQFIILPMNSIYLIAYPAHIKSRPVVPRSAAHFLLVQLTNVPRSRCGMAGRVAGVCHLCHLWLVSSHAHKADSIPSLSDRRRGAPEMQPGHRAGPCRVSAGSTARRRVGRDGSGSAPVPPGDASQGHPRPSGRPAAHSAGSDACGRGCHAERATLTRLTKLRHKQKCCRLS